MRITSGLLGRQHRRPDLRPPHRHLGVNRTHDDLGDHTPAALHHLDADDHHLQHTPHHQHHHLGAAHHDADHQPLPGHDHPQQRRPQNQGLRERGEKGDVIGAPIRDAGTELGRRAADLAHAQIGVTATTTDGDTAGPTHSSFSAANLVRYSYYQASAGRITMPPDIADQINVGDRVAGDAISPGDLVFYNFTATGGPTAVMIATTATLGVDANALNQPISLAVLPAGNVIIKRPSLTDRRGAPQR